MSKIKSNYEIISDKANGVPVTSTEYIKHGDKWLDEILDSTGDYVTPQMFGAIGDGVTDCREAINQALNSDNSNVYFPSGEYYVSDYIQLEKGNKNITLADNAHIFSNKRTRIGHTFGIGDITNNYQYIENPENYQWIENIRITGGKITNTSDSNSENGIGMGFGVRNVTIENCEIHCTRSAITAQYGWENIYVNNCIADSPQFSSIRFELNAENHIAKSVRIENCTVVGDGYGIIVGVSEDAYVSNNTVKANKIGIATFTGKNVIITQNHIDCSMTGVQASHCPEPPIISENEIHITNIISGVPCAGVIGYYSPAIIKDNKIISDDIGIAHHTEVGDVQHFEMTIDGNTISSKTKCLWIRGGTNITISNNSLENSMPYIAIDVEQVQKSLMVTNNHIKKCSEAIHFNNMAVKPIVVANNVKECTNFINAVLMNNNNPISVGNSVSVTGALYLGWKPTTSFDESNGATNMRFNGINIERLSTPTTTTGYVVGDIRFANNPSPGGDFGWVLTASGWKSIGKIAE